VLAVTGWGIIGFETKGNVKGPNGMWGEMED